MARHNQDFEKQQENLESNSVNENGLSLTKFREEMVDLKVQFNESEIYDNKLIGGVLEKMKNR